jgi:hypothetical protein
MRIRSLAIALAALSACGDVVDVRLQRAYVLACSDGVCTATDPLIPLATYLDARPDIDDGTTERIRSIEVRVLAGDAMPRLEDVQLAAAPTALSAELVTRANTALIFHHRDLHGQLAAEASSPAASLAVELEYVLAVERDTASFIP